MAAFNPFARKKIPLFPSVFSRGASALKGAANWSADPLLGADKSQITPGQNAAGLDYNQRLYSPGSPEMDAVFGTTPAPTYPTGWTGQRQQIRPGTYSSPYGTGSVSSASAAPRAVAVPPPDDSGVDGKRLDQFTPGASGALEAGVPGAGVVVPPFPDTPPPAMDASAAGAAAGEALIGAGSMGIPTPNPMGSNMNTNQRGIAPGNQQRYHDMTGRIDGRAPMSPQDSTPRPVTFRDEVPGHSAWQPYL